MSEKTTGKQKTKKKTYMRVTDRRQSSFTDEGVRLISYCPLCESSYSPEQAKVIGEKNDSHLMHICCGNCSSAILALVLVSQVGISSVGLVTDLSHEEVNRFKAFDAVSTDDVIEVHHTLMNERALWDRIFVA